MLREIQCDEFHHSERIEFHKGLNAVIGNESGTNSVGKSTFLMILDFVFGGDDYLTKSKEIHKNLPAHAINFMFEFDGEKYYFSRSTGDPKVVSVCDENYEPIEEWEQKDYLAFLAEHYQLTQDGITLRSALSRFFRVYRRECMDEEKPFKAFKKETDRHSIVEIIKLFGRYLSVKQQEKSAADATDRESAFVKAQKYEYIPRVKNQTEYKKNKERIEILLAEAEELAEKSVGGILDLASFQAEEIKALRARLSDFRREKTSLEAQLATIVRAREEAKKTFQPNYEDLLQFFDNLDIERLTRVEEFHRKVTKILKQELSENEENINAMLELASAEIKKLERELRQVSQQQSLSKAILDKYAALRKELQILIDANAAYDQKNTLHDNAVSAQELLDRTILQEMSAIQQSINVKLEEFNDYIFDGEIEAPRVHVTGANSYEFFTPDDGGTGSCYRGMILFDLAALELTNIPCIAHDSVLLLQIEKEAVERILELYAKTEKQVFIAFDKDTTPRGWEILNAAERLRVTRGGSELFGRPFNKKKKPQTDSSTTEA